MSCLDSFLRSEEHMFQFLARVFIRAAVNILDSRAGPVKSGHMILCSGHIMCCGLPETLSVVI